MLKCDFRLKAPRSCEDVNEEKRRSQSGKQNRVLRKQRTSDTSRLRSEICWLRTLEDMHLYTHACNEKVVEETLNEYQSDSQSTVLKKCKTPRSLRDFAAKNRLSIIFLIMLLR